jgi:hypothetical protein
MYQVFVAYRDPITQSVSPVLPHPDLRFSDAWGEFMAFTWNAGAISFYPPEIILTELLQSVHRGTIPYDSPIVSDTISFMRTLGPWMDYASWMVQRIEE